MVRIYLSYKSHEARRRVKVGESWKRKSQARPGVSRLRVKGGSGAKSWMRRGGRKRRPFFFFFFSLARATDTALCNKFQGGRWDEIDMLR